MNKSGFKQSSIDDCFYYQVNFMYELYIDDLIFYGPYKDEFDQAIQDIQN